MYESTISPASFEQVMIPNTAAAFLANGGPCELTVKGTHYQKVI